MAHHKIQIEIPRDTTLSEDKSVNTFHLSGLLDSTNWTAVKNAFLAFYNTAGPGRTASIASKFAAVANSPARIKAYNMDSAPPRVPLFEEDLALGPYGSDSLPEEVAIVLSFRNRAVTGQNQARRRGRIYLGPLATGVVTIAGGRARLNVATMDDILAPCPRLQDALIAAGTSWQSYSKVANDWNVVQDWTVDDAFDTQRRRGPRLTAKRRINEVGTIVSVPVS